MTLRLKIIFAGLLLAAVGLTYAQTRPHTEPSGVSDPAHTISFRYVDIFIDSGATPLAAYQFEFITLRGDAKLVGVERGDNAGFQDPPYYDPAALQGGRVIVGSFNTGDQLPLGKVRVARLHLQITGAAQFQAKLIVAGNKDGAAIAATVSFVEGAPQ